MKSKIIISVLFTLLVLVLLTASFALRKSPNPNLSTNNKGNENVLGSKDLSTYPVVKNIAPTNAYIGKKYVFDLGVMDSDTYYPNIRVKKVEGPDWLTIDNLSLSGIPYVGSEGSYKVVLNISDGNNSTFYTFYILVSSDEGI